MSSSCMPPHNKAIEEYKALIQSLDGIIRKCDRLEIYGDSELSKPRAKLVEEGLKECGRSIPSR